MIRAFPASKFAAAMAATCVSFCGFAGQLPIPEMPSSFNIRQDPMPEVAQVKPALSYVVLMPSPDGSVGRVVLAGERGSQVLAQPREGAWLDGRGQTASVSKEDLDRDFNAAVAARPPLPTHYILFFELGAAALTKESAAELPRILDRIRTLSTVDISVVGHTDTLGKSEANEILGLKRANLIADALRQIGGKNMTISVESNGERNLLVVTLDETNEKKNRRVEITLR
jgi:adhesin transport system outer membrane protein